MLLVVIMIVFFSSCQKEEAVIVPETKPVEAKVVISPADTLAYQAKVASFLVLNVRQINALTAAQKAKGSKLSNIEVAKVISEIFNLKKAEIAQSENLIIVRPLDSRESFISTDYTTGYSFITRFGVYMAIDDNKNVIEMITFSQAYQIRDGIIDQSSFWFDFELDCPQNVSFSLTKVTNVYNVKCFFIGEDEISFSYNLELFNGNMINIIPFEKGKCIVQGYNQTQGNSAKLFESTVFDCYVYFRNLPLALTIPGISNIRSSVIINTNLLQGVNTIVLKGEDQNGNSLFEYPDVLQTIQLSELSFVATFDIRSVRINGRYGSYEYNTELVKNENGISYYRLIQYTSAKRS